MHFKNLLGFHFSESAYHTSCAIRDAVVHEGSVYKLQMENVEEKKLLLFQFLKKAGVIIRDEINMISAIV